MAGISSYVDPGVYITQKVLPSSAAVYSENTLCIVGIAPRTRRVSSEMIVRGKIYNEVLNLTGTSPYTATLLNVSNRDRSNAVLFRDGFSLSSNDWSFLPAVLNGNPVTGTVDVSVATGNPYFTVSIDNKKFVTVDLDVAVTAVSGTPNAASVDEICDALNFALGDPAGDFFSEYGVAYAEAFEAVVDGSGKFVRINSKVAGPNSSVRVILSMDDAKDAAGTISNNAWVVLVGEGVQAETVVQLSGDVYSGNSEFTLDYVSINNNLDPLAYATAETPLTQVLSVGKAPGGVSYVSDSDFEVSGNTIDWDATGINQATIKSIDGPFTGTGDTLRLSVNGLNPIVVTLTTGSPDPTAAEVAEDINKALNGSPNYGPAYSHVASVDGSKVVLTAPDIFENFPKAKGSVSAIEFYKGTTTGITDIFGIQESQLPFEIKGSGKTPDFGNAYYVSYDFKRHSSDYANPALIYTADDLYNFTSPLTSSNYRRNALAIAGEIAFANGVGKMYLSLVDDATDEGFPTVSQVNAAIERCKFKADITDIVVLDTREATAVGLMDHVSEQSSMLEKQYRRGWYGMARGTEIGDPDTPDTYVYRSTMTLQPGNTSPGRGRNILCAPANVSRTVTLNDSTEMVVDLDGSYLAVSVASIFCALMNPSEPLLGKAVRGFNTDSSFGTFLQGERYALASKGVNVITLEGGRGVMKDPLTTEAGGANVIEFAEPSSSAQKDAVTKAVEKLLDANAKGVVPDDLTIYIVSIKSWISKAIEGMINNGTIANYRDTNGAIRALNPASDIQVYQDETDPRTFIFKYWFNLKYVAKRFFGEYSVDNPFFIE
jgi:hypothetical protein